MAPPSPRSPGRRRFLRGAAGALLALPLLEFDGDRPARAAPFPKRLVIVFTPNGVPASTWASTGGETDFTLGPILAALGPHKDDLVLVDGVDMESSYHGTGDGMHLNGMSHLLTATEMVDVGFGTYWAGGISIDQRIAAEIGSATRLASLELACEDGTPSGRSRLSYLGAAQPVPPESQPDKVFDRLFGSSSPDRLARRKSVLDAVGEDFTALRDRIGKDDRLKIEAHLDAVRSIETRLDIHPEACAAVRPRIHGELDLPHNGRLQMELLVRALACDLTRVVTLMWAPSTSQAVFSWLSITEPHHSLSHATPQDASAQFKLYEINRWYALQMAHLLAAMKAVPEGDGTLLDHSLVLWANELSDGEIHARRGMPFVLAGRAGGALKTGRRLVYGGAMAGANHGKLLTSIANAMDVPLASFGNPAYGVGPLPGLLG